MASDDDAAPVPAPVAHIEGTSYEVAYGDPSRFPLPGSENYHCREFPAAGGENPYQPEMGLMAPLVTDLRILESAPGTARGVLPYGKARRSKSELHF